MVKEIRKFLADDGREFNTEEKASYHEKEFGIKSWYEENKILGNREGSTVEWEHLINWLRKNISKFDDIHQLAKETWENGTWKKGTWERGIWIGCDDDNFYQLRMNKMINEYDIIPERTIQAIRNYVDHRIEGGSFLNAVLSNDLCGAISRADNENARALVAIVRFLYNKCPSICWGSREKVEKYLTSKD